VLSNYSTSPQVSYWEEGKAVYVVFTGERENSFFNVTVPTDLIGGEISLINKYYKVNEDTTADHTMEPTIQYILPSTKPFMLNTLKLKDP